MLGKPFEFKLNGLDELKSAMKSLPDKIRKRAVAKALRAAGRVVRDEARMNVDRFKAETIVLRAKNNVRKHAPNQYRRSGVLRRAIFVRRSKIAARSRMQGVFINVRPLKKGGSRGAPSAKNPNDPFYWRFVEFGTKKMRAGHFLSKAAEKLPQAGDIFVEVAAAEINRLDTRV